MNNDIPPSARDQTPREAVKDARLSWHQSVEQHRAGDDRVDTDVLLLDALNYCLAVNAAVGGLDELVGGLRSQITEPDTQAERILKLGNRIDKTAIAELGLPQTLSFPGEE